MSLRSYQVQALQRMLMVQDGAGAEAGGAGAGVGAGGSGAGAGDPLGVAGVGPGAMEWKVLLYDDVGQEIIAPLLTTADLRRLGITLFLNIKQKRERVADVPAIYFLAPTSQNIQTIVRDIKDRTYDSFHLHFTSSLPRPLLEELASLCLQHGLASRISRVYDQYAQFVSLEEQLFSLQLKDSHVALNHPNQSEEAIMAYLDSIVDSLLSVFATMGSVPIIRAPPNTAAAMLAQRLDDKLRSHLNGRSSLFGASAGSVSMIGVARPLLVLLDRNADISAPLHHGWTYQALLNDLLGFASNRITITTTEDAPAGSGAPPKVKNVTYDLNTTEDKFWRANAARPFPVVAEAVQEKLARYQEDYNRITHATKNSSFDSAASTADLSSAIDALPKLKKRKEVIDAHMNIALTLLKSIQSRNVDMFAEIEQRFLSRSNVDRAELDKLVATDGGKGTLRDRVRAVLIWWLSNESATAEQITALQQLLESQASSPEDKAALQKDLASFAYVKQFRFLHRLTSQTGAAGTSSASSLSSSSAASPASSSSSSGGPSWSMFGQLAQGLANEVVQKTTGVLAGVRNLLPGNTDFPLTRIVEALATNRDTSVTERYLYLDPKLPKGKTGKPSRHSQGGGAAGAAGASSSCVVFVLGGGCYAEYQNMQEWARRQAEANGSGGAVGGGAGGAGAAGGASAGGSGAGGAGGAAGGASVQSLIYGCTEVVSPDAFLAQLVALAASS